MMLAVSVELILLANGFPVFRKDVVCTSSALLMSFAKPDLSGRRETLGV